MDSNLIGSLFLYEVNHISLASVFGSLPMTHLGLHTGKISLKSVRSIEHVFCHLGRPYRAMAHRCQAYPMDALNSSRAIQCSFLSPLKISYATAHKDIVL